MSTPIISFVVPAYNAGRYLRACLDSICRIDMGGLGREVIVVNDGSEDETASLLEAYTQNHTVFSFELSEFSELSENPKLKTQNQAPKDTVFKVITQENQGLSCARNTGIKAATGRYICFVDADDTLLEATLPNALLGQDDIDIIGINVMRKDAKGALSRYRRYRYDYGKMYSPARRFMLGRNLMPCAWAYIYRADFLRSAGLLFTPHICCEDEDFTPRAFAAAQTFMAADTDWYLYTERADSITTTTDTARRQWRLRDIVSTLKRLDDMAAGDADFGRCARYKLDYLTVDALQLLLRERHTMAFRHEIVARLRAMGRFPLKWHCEPKHIVFNILTRLLLHNCR